MCKLVAAAAWLFVACGSKQPTGNAGSSTVAALVETTPTPKPPQRVPNGNGGSMTTDFKPSAAFRAHAAKVLKVPIGEVEGSVVESTAARMPHSIAGAWACDMSHGEREVRGWVTADATVITPDQNLGILFVEAGVWDKPPKGTPDELADRLAGEIVWSYGMNNAVVQALDYGMAPPKLNLAVNSSGTLRLFSYYRRPGPGGAGGGPTSYFEFNVVLTGDHKATLTKKPFEPTP
jgi:hypothetical protein